MKIEKLQLKFRNGIKKGNDKEDAIIDLASYKRLVNKINEMIEKLEEDIPELYARINHEREIRQLESNHLQPEVKELKRCCDKCSFTDELKAGIIVNCIDPDCPCHHPKVEECESWCEGKIHPASCDCGAKVEVLKK